MLAAFPDGQVFVRRRVPVRVDFVASEDADLSAGSFHDSGVPDALHRNTPRRGEAVRRSEITCRHAVLLEPRKGEARLGVERTLNASQVFIELSVDELQRGFYGHGSVGGFQHGLAAAEHGHARTNGRLRHIGGRNVRLLQPSR